jgi:hypothetical protein
MGQTKFSVGTGREPLTHVCDAGRRYQKLVYADLLIPENLSTSF